MKADEVPAGGTRRFVLTVLTFAASLFCLLAIAAAVYGLFTPSGIGLRGIAMVVVAIVLGFLAVKFDDARKAVRSPHRAGPR